MGLRERLRNRPRPGVPVRLQVDDPREAERHLEEALIGLRLAQTRGADEQAVDGLRAGVEAARVAVETCFEEVRVTAMPPEDLEALIGAHPPREDGEDESWNRDTFPRALLLECLPDDMTADEWQAWLRVHCSDGEIAVFEAAALRINVRAPEGTLPKGWTQSLA